MTFQYFLIVYLHSVPYKTDCLTSVQSILTGLEVEAICNRRSYTSCIHRLRVTRGITCGCIDNRYSTRQLLPEEPLIGSERADSWIVERCLEKLGWNWRLSKSFCYFNLMSQSEQIVEGTSWRSLRTRNILTTSDDVMERGVAGADADEQEVGRSNTFVNPPVVYPQYEHTQGATRFPDPVPVSPDLPSTISLDAFPVNYVSHLHQGLPGCAVLNDVAYDCGMRGAPKVKQGFGSGVASGTVETPLKTHQHISKSRNYLRVQYEGDAELSDDELDLREEELKLRAEEVQLRLKRLEIRRKRESRDSNPLDFPAEEGLSVGATPLPAVPSVSHRELETSLRDLTLGLTLPKIEIATFDGSPIEFTGFISSFEVNVSSRLSDDGQRLSFLLHYCKGSAKMAIQHCVMLPSREGFTEAMRILRDRFGRPHEIIQAATKGLLDGPRLSNGDLEGLRDMAIQMRGCYLMLCRLGRTQDIDCTLYLLRLVERLPRSMQDRWADVADSIINTGREPSFHDLLNYLEKRISVSSNLYGQLAAKSMSQAPRPDSYKARVTPNNARFAAVHQQPQSLQQCILCRGGHGIRDCTAFLNKTPTERLNILRVHKHCFACLQANHVARTCRNASRCTKPGCNRWHHLLLHDDEVIPSSVGSTHCASEKNKRVRLGCVPLRLVGPLGFVDTYGFIDNGSDATLIDRNLAKRLGLSMAACELSIDTVHGRRMVVCHKTSLKVQSLSDWGLLDVECAYTVDRLPFAETNSSSDPDTRKWPHLSDVRLLSLPDKNIGILLGCDVPEVHEVLDQRMGVGKQPYAVKTALGWIIRGPYHGKAAETKCVNHIGVEEGSLVETLARFFESEFIDPTDPETKASSVEDQRALTIAEGSAVLLNGRYVVGMPWRDTVGLPNNYSIAKRRLECLRRRLVKDRDLHTKYAAIFQDHLTKGYISRVEFPKQHGRWFLPHHPVLNPNKPGKVRIVFDCAAVYQGKSVNSELLSGPDLTNELTGVIIRFRKFPIALCADIEEMFLQVGVLESDKKRLSFLWWANGELKGEPSIYQLNVHPFGATSSPFCATYALRRTARDNKLGLSEECCRAVMDNFYVDDCLLSVSDLDEAVRMVDELRGMLASGGFRLLKWASNCHEALRRISEGEKSTTMQDHNCLKVPAQSTLGLRWNVGNDSFEIVPNLPEKPTTRRGILACVASLYDPLGFSAPMSLPARQLLQELSNNTIGWDSTLPDDYIKRWDRWLIDIRSVASLRVPRHVGLSKPNLGRVELHMFCDASDAGYGAAGYLRVINENQISCHFMMGKSRVAPRKISTIPRMELVAAVLSVKLLNHLSRELRMFISRTTLWTDSTIVLHYLRNTTSRFTTFVSNRIRYITENAKGLEWRHVPSKLNPADVASRGAHLVDSPEMELWIKGPKFLLQDENAWPRNRFETPQSDEGLELKSVSALVTAPVWHDSWFRKYSDWVRLLRSVAWMARFKRYFMVMKSATSRGNLKLGNLDVSELNDARMCVVRLVQEECFEDHVSHSYVTAFRKLNPVKINGVWCVGGRLQGSEYVDLMHPVILPARHAVTDLVIRYFHDINGHVGAVQVLAAVHQWCWILKGMAQVRRVIRNCPKCRLLYSAPCEQIMAPLPPERVLVGSRPFRFCGTDYFGPFKVKSGRSDNKRYGCLFTCLQTRAVHIEVSNTLTTDSFLMALMRFMNRRGVPETIFSDNGSNFVGAESELRQSLIALNQGKLSDSLVSRGINWRFNPPGASHRGGVWERVIRSVRRLLAAVVVEQVMSDEVLLTSLTEVERILNDRPIVPVYDDPSSPTALRPSDLLLIHPTPSPMDSNVTLADSYRKGWKQAQHIAGTFWRRWLREYLPTLQQRQKWLKVRRDIKTGDLVLLVDNSAPRGVWKKGLVVGISSNSDGHPRDAEVRTAGGVVRKDIRSLCLLEGVEDDARLSYV